MYIFQSCWMLLLSELDFSSTLLPVPASHNHQTWSSQQLVTACRVSSPQLQLFSHTASSRNFTTNTELYFILCLKLIFSHIESVIAWNHFPALPYPARKMLLGLVCCFCLLISWSRGKAPPLFQLQQERNHLSIDCTRGLLSRVCNLVSPKHYLVYILPWNVNLRNGTTITEHAHANIFLWSLFSRPNPMVSQDLSIGQLARHYRAMKCLNLVLFCKSVFMLQLS